MCYFISFTQIAFLFHLNLTKLCSLENVKFASEVPLLLGGVTGYHQIVFLFIYDALALTSSGHLAAAREIEILTSIVSRN